MKLLKVLAFLASLFIAGQAIACPERCLCDRKGHVVSDYRYLKNVNDNKVNNQIHNSQSQSQSQSQTSTNVNQNVNNNQSNSTSSVKNSGNSTVTTKVTATGGTATATGGSATSSSSAQGGAGGSATVGNVSTGASTSSASADGAGTNNGNGSNNTTVTTVVPRQVATAYAASLTSGQDVCAGSFSGGAQTEIFGLSLGGTKTDANCVLIKQVQLLQQLGYAQAACFRARQGKEGKAIDEAMKAAGVDCATLSTPVPADVVTHEELRDHEQRIVTKVLQK